MARARLGSYVLGVAGVALLRRWLGGDPARNAARVREMAELVGGFDEGLLAVELDVPELDVVAGYASWARTYDTMPNPLIRLEEPIVHALVNASSPGDALDAGCGTGRHAGYLAARGHRVIGVDLSPAMLGLARSAYPSVDFREGRLAALPIDTASADLVVCALALTHVADVGPPIAELARVARPGARVVVSDFHPAMALFGGQALFEAADGTYAYVTGQLHTHGVYLSAFRAAGLEVRRCLEPSWGEAEVPLIAGPLNALAPDAFREALVGIPGALVWESVRA